MPLDTALARSKKEKEKEKKDAALAGDGDELCFYLLLVWDAGDKLFHRLGGRPEMPTTFGFFYFLCGKEEVETEVWVAKAGIRNGLNVFY